MPIAELMIEIARTASASELPWSLCSATAIAGGRSMLNQDSTSFTGPPADRVVSTPSVCGGEPRIAGTRIPVSVLVQCREIGFDDARILKGYPTLSPEDLAAAWAFAERSGLVR